MTIITARSNARVRRWRELGRDSRLRRNEGKALIEGEHLVASLLDAGGKAGVLILSETGLSKYSALAQRAGPSIVLSDEVFRAMADTESPAGIAAEIDIPAPSRALKDARSAVFLEGVQDAGNVGTILRSAAAFGIHDAVMGPGCADAWSPKVLRSGMGAHFTMSIRESAELAGAIREFGGKLCCAVPRGGVALPEANLSGRVGWLLGAEGQGVSELLAARADLKVTIPMPGSAESLNVAAAAAVCFYEFSRRAARA